MPRERIDTGTDKRYVRRDEKGQFKESDDVGRTTPKIRSASLTPSLSKARATRATADC